MHLCSDPPGAASAGLASAPHRAIRPPRPRPATTTHREASGATLQYPYRCTVTARGHRRMHVRGIFLHRKPEQCPGGRRGSIPLRRLQRALPGAVHRGRALDKAWRRLRITPSNEPPEPSESSNRRERGEAADIVMPAPEVAPVTPVTPDPGYHSPCGRTLDQHGNCPKCGEIDPSEVAA